ncbi:LPXTG cell wall anchor domain-containing protein [Solidesulfovibrio sp.]
MDDIRDIKGPVPLGETIGTWPLWAGAGVLVLAGLAVWRRRRLCRIATDRQLAALAALGPDGGDLDDRDYAFRLAGLVREILETRHGFAATTMTAGEIAARLAATSLPRSQALAVQALFDRAELACFAARPLARRDRAGDWQTAGLLARGSRPC